MNLCPQCRHLRPKLARPGLCRACKAAALRLKWTWRREDNQ